MNTDSWTPTRPLPDGANLLLEASAGTGKTYQMEGLVLRLVVEHGCAIDRILVITFTRAAAAELRGRIRARLVSARRVFVEGREPDAKDNLLWDLRRHWSSSSPDTIRARIEQAIQDYDRAVIATIHSFTHDTLTRFAVESQADLDPRADLPDRDVQRRLLRDVLAALGAGEGLAALRFAEEARLPPSCSGDALLGGIIDTRGAVIEPALDRAEPRWTTARQFCQWVAVRRAVLEADRVAIEPTVQAAGRDAVAAFLAWADGEGKGDVDLLPGMPNTLAAWNGKASGEPDLRGPQLFRSLRASASSGAWEPLLDAVGHASKWAVRGGSRNKLGERAVRADAAVARLGVLHGALTAAVSMRPTLNLAPHLAEHLRAAWHAARQDRALRSFDTLLLDLQHALEAEAATGEVGPLTSALRSAYDAVLVDEFQDTDLAQWATLRHVFVPSPQHRFVGVGDPKQSIYRFRGANLHVYFGAREAMQRSAGGAQYRLDQNHRSHREIVGVMNALWGDGADGATDSRRFLTSRITHGSVTSTKEGGSEPPGGRVQLRWFDSGGLLNKAQSGSFVVRCAVRHVRRLLAAGKKPSSIAVLANMHHELALVADALATAGIPSVRRLQKDLFHTEPARWLVDWLEALAAPEQEGATRRLALGPFVGWDVPSLTRAVERPDTTPHGAAWARLRADVVAAADRFDDLGVAVTFDRWERRRHVLAAAVGCGGERDATDLRHLVSWLDAQARSERLGPSGLAAELRTRRAGASKTGDEDESAVMPEIETDADAVRLVTIYASKGLQYDHVLLPFAWYERELDDEDEPLRFSGPDGNARTDLSAPGTASREAAFRAVADETREEARRLLYVALTRAKEQVVAWLGAYGDPSKNKVKVFDSALAKLLGVTALPGAEKRLGLRPDLLRPDGTPIAGLHLHVDRSDDPEPARPDLPAAPPPTLEPWRRTHRLNARWVLTSYSGLSPGTPVAVGTDLGQPASRGGDDEPSPAEDPALGASAGPPPARPPATGSAPLPEPPPEDLREKAVGADFFGGTGTGSWLHGVLEQVDFQDPTAALDGRPLATLLTEEGLRHGVVDPDQLALAARALPAWLATPFGAGLRGVAPAACLRGIGPDRRADELQFHVRLGSGHGKDQSVDEAAVRAALGHALTDPAFRGRAWLRAFLDRKTAEGEPAAIVGRLTGFLHGFIDAVFQFGDGEDARFVVCDYKSNDLSGTAALRDHTAAWAPRKDADDKPIRLRRWHYDQPNLETGMDHHHYHLQALIYSVAVHRMLARRVPGYDYDRHVAGHAYLFLRGMEGEGSRTDAAGRTLGVWLDRWPKATVEGLSAALGGGR